MGFQVVCTPLSGSRQSTRPAQCTTCLSPTGLESVSRIVDWRANSPARHTTMFMQTGGLPSYFYVRGSLVCCSSNARVQVVFLWPQMCEKLKHTFLINMKFKG